MKEELDARDENLRKLWCRELGQLRDDLTARRLIDGLQQPQGAALKAAPVHVLVVDDYPEVLRAIAKILKSYGMVVQEASSGAAAAKILESDPQIEVVLADISMPKNGYTLLEHVRKVHPIVEVVMTSGVVAEAARARQLGAFAFLAKPFELDYGVLVVERAAEFRRLKLAATSKG